MRNVGFWDLHILSYRQLFLLPNEYGTEVSYLCHIRWSSKTRVEWGKEPQNQSH